MPKKKKQLGKEIVNHVFGSFKTIMEAQHFVILKL